MIARGFRPPALPVRPPPTEIDPDRARAILDVLMRPHASSETVAAVFALKELELRGLFERLTVVDAFTLHLRLANPDPADPIAKAFARLAIERRVRLLGALVDARRGR